MAAMGAGHLIALADAGIEGSQACFGSHGGYVAGKQQDYTKYRCSHRWSAWLAPPANANGTTEVSDMVKRIPRIPHGTVWNEFAKKHLPADGHSSAARRNPR